MTSLLQELDTRWRHIFEALAGGEDVAPARRLRTEGLMEAAALLGLATQEDLLAAMDDCYREAFGHTLAQDFGEDWPEFYPFPVIPAVGRRAPVYPTTRD